MFAIGSKDYAYLRNITYDNDYQVPKVYNSRCTNSRVKELPIFSQLSRDECDKAVSNYICENDSIAKSNEVTVHKIPLAASFYKFDYQVQSLANKPACFVIFGKPGTGCFRLGEQLSREWKCIHIYPDAVIREEVISLSNTGKCLKFNIRCGFSISSDIILKLIVKKAKSQLVLHRGYVISGLPLVPSTSDSKQLMTKFFSELAILISADIALSLIAEVVDLAEERKRLQLLEAFRKKRAQRFAEMQGEGGGEGRNLLSNEEDFGEDIYEDDIPEIEGEQGDSYPFKGGLQDEFGPPPVYIEPGLLGSGIVTQRFPKIVDIRNEMVNQIKTIFSLDLKPDVIIYITCPDEDVISRRINTRHIYPAELVVRLPFKTKHPQSSYEDRWPKMSNMSDPGDNNLDIEPFLDTYPFKYLIKRPIDMGQKINNQSCTYKEAALPLIEKIVVMHDPQRVIKVDGRCTIARMIKTVLGKLDVLPFAKANYPIALSDLLDETGEDDTVDDEENELDREGVEGPDAEFIFSTLHKYTPIDNRFPLTRSPWNTWCPVALKSGRYIKGNPTFAVAFLNKVFVLDSEISMYKFCINPRQYLNVDFLKPSCRICIIGFENSGVSLVANCLASLLQGVVIDFDVEVKYLRNQKENEILTTVIPEILPQVDKNRQNTNMSLTDEFKEWEGKCRLLVLNYVDIAKSLKLLKSNLQNTLLGKPLMTGDVEFLDGKINVEELRKDLDEVFDKDLEYETFYQYGNLKTEFYELRPIFSNIITEFETTGFSRYDNYQFCSNVLNEQIVLNWTVPQKFNILKQPLLEAIETDDDVIEFAKKFTKQENLFDSIIITEDDIYDEIVKKIIQIDYITSSNSNGEILYGNWIVTGSLLHNTFWEKLNSSRIFPDDIICLCEDLEKNRDLFSIYKTFYPYANNGFAVISRVKEELEKRSLPFMAVKTAVIVKEVVKDAFTKKGIPNDLLSNYVTFERDIVGFHDNWENVKIFLNRVKVTPIEIPLRGKPIENVVAESIARLQSKYSPKLINRQIMLAVGEEEVEEEEFDEETEGDVQKQKPEERRVFGETGLYCPVAYKDFSVLWKGIESFSMEFENKLYLMANDQNFKEFCGNPRKYCEFLNPVKVIPPIRICVTGPMGSGRSSVAKMLCRELGLIYVDFSLSVNKKILGFGIKKVGKEYENIFEYDELQVDYEIDHEIPFQYQTLQEVPIHLRRKYLFRYFEYCEPMPDLLLEELLSELWFKYPFSRTGFVLDGYPRVESDFKTLTSFSTIPNLILELDIKMQLIHSRIFDAHLHRFRTLQQLERFRIMKEHLRLYNRWFKQVDGLTSVKYFLLILEKNVFKCLDDKLNSLMPYEDNMIYAEYVDNVLDIETEYESSDIDRFTKDLLTAIPEPNFEEPEWESDESARDRIASRLHECFQIEAENMKTLQINNKHGSIPWITIKSSDDFDTVFKNVLIAIYGIIKYNESIFEQTFSVNYDVAIKLIDNGIFFMSKFGVNCPVQIYKDNNPIQMYLPNMHNFNIYPVIHRCCIYFVGGREQCNEFRRNPLKFIYHPNIDKYTMVPLKVAVIGPPKSGKSCLSSRFGDEFGLRVISRGQAIRYVLDKLYWTELALKMELILHLGKELPTNLIIKCVQIASIHHKCLTQGFVFDGFPETASEASELARIGIFPYIIFDMDCLNETSFEYLQSDNKYYLHRNPILSKKFHLHRYDCWIKSSDDFRKWIDGDYQNRYNLDSTNSKWLLWNNVKYACNTALKEIQTYLLNVDNIPVKLRALCVSPKEFDERRSDFKQYCPVCLTCNRLTNGGIPPGRRGLVQYLNVFYWICDKHMDEFIGDPNFFICNNNKGTLPEELPLRQKYYDKCTVFEDGMCLVTYAEALPARRIEKGSPELAVAYKNRTYLFKDEASLKRFTLEPKKYVDVKMIFRDERNLPPLKVLSLPHLGYLQQTVAKMITDACNNTCIIRPKYPGLSLGATAAIHIALYFKLHNPLTKLDAVSMYADANSLFEEHCQAVDQMGKYMRSRDNPFIEYPSPEDDLERAKRRKEDSKRMLENDQFSGLLPPGTILPPGLILTEELILAANLLHKCPCHLKYCCPDELRRVPVPDERYDYLCEYHKPASKVPAFLNVVDIAGLVRGAAEGQGLGNAFLSHIKACDAIFHLCRAFEDDDVTHVDGEVDPIRDLETISEELRLKDAEQLLQNLDKLERTVGRGGDKKIKPEFDALHKIKGVLVDEKKHLRFADWSVVEIDILNKYLFLTSKPAIYLVNLAEKDYIRKKNKWLPKLKEWVDKNDPGSLLIPFSGAFENKIADMTPEERAAFLKENNITSALDKIIVQGYKALQLEYFFTAGADEVKAWTIQKGTKAPQAAGRIHTDFEKGFIMAEVMHFKDFKEEGSEPAAKAAGKYRQQGRNYTVEDGDIIFFKFNAGAGLKDAKKK